MKSASKPWIETTVAHVCALENGDRGANYPPPGSFVSVGVPFVNAGHLRSKRIDFSKMDYITKAAFDRLGAGKFTQGDILFCLRGSLGKFGVVGRGTPPGAIASSLVIIRPKSGVVLTEYLASYLDSEICAREVEKWAGGAAQPNLGASDLARFVLPLPSLAEQRRLAKVLGDADALIAALQRMITKKQAIKQGMMQELLTGRTRLPGFNQKWYEVTAGDIGSFRGGSGFPLRFQGSEAGTFPFFKVSDMNTESNELFMKRANNYVSETQRRQMAAVVMPPGAIVFAKVGAAVFLERKRILTVPSCIDNNMAAFMLDSSRADVRFVHYALCNVRMGSLVATGALPSLNGTQLRSIPIALPGQLSEQRAIAGALADADYELDLLHRRVAKARDIKQGMMQELLTGRTRLPVMEGVV